jgi:hypothetical protein
MLSAVFGVLQMFFREDARLTARSGISSQAWSGSDLWVLIRDDAWANTQFNVVWISPAGNGDAILPPGLDILPSPGAFAVSPELDRLCNQYAELAQRYPTRTVIKDDGIVHGAELLAYARPRENEDISQYPAAVRITSFGSGSDAPALVIGDINKIDYPMLLLFTSMFLFAPIVTLLVVGALATSEHNRRRNRTLMWLGAAPGTIVRLALAESAFLIVPTAILAVVVWQTWSKAISSLPVVNHLPLDGDLTLGVPVLAIISVVVLGPAGLATVAAAAGDIRQGSMLIRPQEEARRPSKLRGLPIAVSGSAMILAGLSVPGTGRQQSDVYPFYAALIAFLVSLPLALPLGVKFVGALLARRPSASSWLAGRFIQYNPIRSARTFAAAGLMIALAMCGLTLFSTFKQDIASAQEFQSDAVFHLSWIPQARQGAESLATRLPEDLIVAYQPSTGGSGLDLYVKCSSLARYIPRVDCVDSQPYAVSIQGEHAVADSLGVGSTSIALRSGNAPRSVRFAFVLTRGDGEVADKRVRTAAMNTLVGPSVTSRVFLQVRPPEQSGWILGATIAGSAILSFVCILSVLDTAIRLGQRRFQLAKLSLSPRQFRSLKIQTFLLPLLLVSFIGIWLGLWLSSVIAAVFNTALPIAQLVLVGVYAVGLSISAAFAVAFFSND